MTLEEKLRETAIEIAPEFPGIETADPWQCLWAIKTSYEGCCLANEDLHGLIDILRQRLGMTKAEVYTLWNPSNRDTERP